ncbi:acyltransferase family protein [Synechocystis sp. PCC 7509]|uniref:acyltransferase family protein n=1 Tax=Synechocystis sp. PCC 7509 TaxID=927677 RepID=UPI0002AC44BE|nr:acyltransferase family protein [Synechocystis sp. PCC 7509]
MNVPKKNRIYWIDYAKGIGIFLVVLGHVCRGLEESSILAPSIAKSINQWIYAFHMPIFFFLSGLLIQYGVSKSFRTFIVDKLKTIAYPYFVWSIIQGVLVYLASQYTNSSISLTSLWEIIYQPIFVFWFFYVLFIILILYKIAHDFKITPLQFLAFSIVLYCWHVLQLSLISWQVLDLVCSFTIYFAIGATVSNRLMPSLDRINVPTLILITTSGFLAIGAIVWLNMAENQGIFPIVAMIGVSATIACAVLLDRFEVASFVKLWGLLSLQIYVVHTLCTAGTRICLQKLFGITEPAAHIILGTVVGIYAPIAIDWLCRQVKFSYLFTFRPQKIA